MPEQVKVGIRRQIAILKKLREKFKTEEGIVVEIDETKEVLLKTYNPMNEIKVATRQSESHKPQQGANAKPKKTAQNTSCHARKSQLSPRQKPQLKFFQKRPRKTLQPQKWKLFIFLWKYCIIERFLEGDFFG